MPDPHRIARLKAARAEAAHTELKEAQENYQQAALGILQAGAKAARMQIELYIAEELAWDEEFFQGRMEDRAPITQGYHNGLAKALRIVMKMGQPTSKDTKS